MSERLYNISALWKPSLKGNSIGIWGPFQGVFSFFSDGHMSLQGPHDVVHLHLLVSVDAYIYNYNSWQTGGYNLLTYALAILWHILNILNMCQWGILPDPSLGFNTYLIVRIFVGLICRGRPPSIVWSFKTVEVKCLRYRILNFFLQLQL